MVRKVSMHIARAIICGLPGFVAAIACAQDSGGGQTVNDASNAR